MSPAARELANALRFLSIDAIQKANSGHPGMPMGMADIAEVLWRDFLKHNPVNPAWVNRDRFVVSNGHGSMLLYSLLHLSGYDLSLDDLKNFRQMNSKTPGHPEVGHAPGVETTTGPLGQGLANAVGMALAEKILRAQFNKPGHDIIDHYTYVFCGDGCLMEGISHEVCSLAGLHKLGKLVVFWDNNHISIDGNTDGWFGDNTPARFEAYGWHVIREVDGHDREEIKQAINQARFNSEQPTLVCCKTHLAFGSPNMHDTAKAHGSPLGDAEIALTRENLGWQHEPFVIPEAVVAAWNAKPNGERLENHWQELFGKYESEHPELAAELVRRMHGELPVNWPKASDEFVKSLTASTDKIATRKASQKSLEGFGPLLPELFGGSADLTGSNLTNWSGSKIVTSVDADGNYFCFGVREFGMCAILNGMALHSGFIPYGGTFLVFSDYARNAIRLAAMMHIKVVFVLTHDSIGLGEDGPTHQPIEHVASLRLIPNLSVWRPCDTTETAVAWQHAIEHNGPTCLILTRQGVEPQQHKDIELIKRGGYVVFESDKEPEAILLATGSEVEIAVAAAKLLQSEGKSVRVVSMPAVDVFLKQDEAYRELVLPANVTKRVALEAGVSDCWYRFVGSEGRVIGIDEFGRSAPAKEIFAEFGLEEQNTARIVRELLES